MTLHEMHTPLSSTVSLAVLVVACALHLFWHPLKAYFSDSLDFMRTHRLPLGLAILAWILSGGSDPITNELKIGWLRGDFSRMDQDAASLMRAGLQDALVLLQVAFPPMPLLLLLPFWIVALTVEVMRYPFRYGRTKIRGEEQAVLLALSVISITWAIVYVATRWMERKAGLDLALSVGGFAFGALGAAGYQVWLARLVKEWASPREEVPEEADGHTARLELFARWQSLLWLGGVNMVWMSFAGWIQSQDPWWAWAVLFEALFFLGPLPVAIAVGKGSFWRAGAGAIKCLWRCGLALLSWVLTALLILGLARYAALVLGAQFPGGGLSLVPPLLNAIAMALLGTWLLVTVILVLYRIGFPPQDRGTP